MRPKFIVVEALDGVGKTTLVRALAERLEGEARNTPGDVLRGVSESVLRGLGPNQVARCLFYAASVVAQGVSARERVEEGCFVVMDRYWLSTVAYAAARGMTASLDDVEALVPAPDLTVLLVLNEEERARRLQDRGLTAADRETQDPAFRARVIDEMRSLARPARLRPSVVVDVTGLEVDAIVDRIADLLLRLDEKSCPH